MIQELCGAKGNLYFDLLKGFKEMAEDARAEEDVLNLMDRYLADPVTLGEADKVNMERKIFDGIAYVWDRMAVTACCHHTVPFKKMQRLFRETYGNDGVREKTAGQIREGLAGWVYIA